MQSIKTQIEAYITANKMRRTKERTSLIECVASMKEFSITELLNHAASNGVTNASAYLFVGLLVKIGIVKIQERYVWSDEVKKRK